MKVYHGKNNRSGIRDYGRRNYGNPLFKNTPRNRNRPRDFRQIKKLCAIVLAVAIAVSALWYLFWGPAFRITDIVIRGASSDTETIIRESLETRLLKRRLLVFPQSSLFLYDVKEAEGDIRAKFYLDNLEIRKKLPHTVTVEVKEKTAMAGMLVSGDFLALDESGFVIRSFSKRERIAMKDLPDGFEAVDSGELGAESVAVAEMAGTVALPTADELRQNSNPMPLVLDRENSDGKYRPGEQAVSTEILTLILQAHTRLPDVAGSGIRWFALESASDTVDVLLRQGWHVYLTTIIPFDAQSERLGLVLREKIGDRISELEYVDLRYDERIFFRYRGEGG